MFYYHQMVDVDRHLYKQNKQLDAEWWENTHLLDCNQQDSIIIDKLDLGLFIEQLPTKYKRLIKLLYYDGYTIKELSSDNNFPIGRPSLNSKGHTQSKIFSGGRYLTQSAIRHRHDKALNLLRTMINEVE